MGVGGCFGAEDKDNEEDKGEGENELRELIGHFQDDARLKGPGIEGDVAVFLNDDDQEGNRTEKMDDIVNRETEGVQASIFGRLLLLGNELLEKLRAFHAITINQGPFPCINEASVMAFGASGRLFGDFN
jgi:hypothetical protein